VAAHDAFGGEVKSDIQQFVSKNDVPGMVVLKSPSDQSVANGPAVTLQWTDAIDPEGGDVMYDVYIGTGATPPLRVATIPGATAYILNNAADGIHYTWYVVARDAWNGETTSEVWEFTCQSGGVNQPPSIALLTMPINNAQDVPDTVVFSWTASQDPEGEVVLYNIYLGVDVNALSLIGEKVNATSLSVGGELQGNTIYYWKVEAVDAANNTTSSDIWSFRSAEKFAIAGSIRTVTGDFLGGVTVRVGDQAVQTDNEGYYSVEVPASWSGDITPISASYRFLPHTLTISNLQADSVGNNFTAVTAGYIFIEGLVRDEAGKGMDGINIVGIQEDVVTNVNGKYILEVPTGWSGAIAAQSADYKFIPDAVSFVHVTNDQHNIDFTGTIVLDVFMPEAGQVKVYPNPTRGPVTLMWSASIGAEGQLVVTASTGQEVSRKPVTQGAKFIHVDLTSGGRLRSGIYQCTLYDRNRKVFSVRMVILD
jgi:hypothetical protein